MIPLKLVPKEPITTEARSDGMTLSITPAGGFIDIIDLPDLTNVRYLVLDITTLADMHLPVEILFYKKGAAENEITMTTSSIPGVRAVMPFDLE